MKIFTCTGFKGHYPVGTAAVVRAANQAEAADKLNAELISIGLHGGVSPEAMIQFTNKTDVAILCDGNY